MPTLKGIEASLFYVQCFLYLLQKMSLCFILHCEYLLDRTHISLESQNTNLKEDMHPYVQSSIIYNSQDLETAQVLLSR